jgi:dTMP kinase
MSVQKNFVVLEGGDGSGTTTQLEILTDKVAQGMFPVPFRADSEPTRGPVGTLLRRYLSGELPHNPYTLACLFAADRAEHLYCQDGIVSTCGAGTLLVCDRYVLSSLVYQGIECGADVPLTLNARFPAPELILFFDMDPTAALARTTGRRVREIYENVSFQEKVRALYRENLDFCRSQGSAVQVIDASQTVENVERQVWSALQNLPIIIASSN